MKYEIKQYAPTSPLAQMQDLLELELCVYCLLKRGEYEIKAQNKILCEGHEINLRARTSSVDVLRRFDRVCSELSISEQVWLCAAQDLSNLLKQRKKEQPNV